MDLPEVSTLGNISSKALLKEYKTTEEAGDGADVDPDPSKWLKGLRRIKRRLEQPRSINSFVIYDSQLDSSIEPEHVERECNEKMGSIL